MEPLVAAALAVNQDNLALGHEVFEAAGARFVRNATFPSIRDANHVDNITVASVEINALLDRAEREFRGYPHLRFDIDARTPPEFEARLQLDGRYMRSETLIMVLEGDLRGPPPHPFEVQHIGDEEGWKAFGALHELDWAEDARSDEPRPVATGRDMARAMRLKSPLVRYWLGYIDDEPAGYLTSWEGTGGVGQVETLYVHPEFRHRGLATALLHHCVHDCRALGAGPVVIAAASDGTPKQMYAAMGWRPLAVKREYTLPRSAGSAQL